MTKLKPVDRALALLAAAVIGIYFFRLARPSLHLYFTADDFQNLWRCWFWPVRDLVKANLLFFWTSDFNRPMVSDWYRVIFHFAGLNPFWFRAANLVALSGNICLTYAVARRLSSSREVGMVTALLFSYSQAMKYLYFDTGFTCDVLGYLFYFATFLFYLRIRQAGRSPRVWETVVLVLLFICALNAKEIAVTLPPVILIYELIWNPPLSRRPRELARYAIRDGRTSLIFGMFVLALIIGRSVGPNSLMLNEAYRPVLTWERFMLTGGTFLMYAMDEKNPWSPWAVFGLWAGMGAIAWFSRQRDLRFAWAYIMVSPLPVAFILPRGTPQYYVPWFGWMFFGAILLVRPIQYITGRLLPAWPSIPRLRGALLLAVLIAVRYPYYKRFGFEGVYSITQESSALQQAAVELRQLRPQMKPGARVLLLKDPIPTGWTLYIITLVSYGDRSLYIYDVQMNGKPPDEATMPTFDYIFDYQGGHYVEVK